MQLSKHFTYKELTQSSRAITAGIDNTPPRQALDSLIYTANLLDLVRDQLGHPILISSGYRNYALNRLVGGAINSDHMKGLAVDITCPEFGTPLQLCEWIYANIKLSWDQIIHEYGNWCHLSFALPDDAPRKQLLTIKSATSGYISGLWPV